MITTRRPFVFMELHGGWDTAAAAAAAFYCCLSVFNIPG